MRRDLIDHARVEERQRELEALSPEAFAERARRAAAEPAEGAAALARHEVAHEQMVEMWTRTERVEEGACPR